MEPPYARLSLRPYAHLLRRIDAPGALDLAISVEENPLSAGISVFRPYLVRAIGQRYDFEVAKRVDQSERVEPRASRRLDAAAARAALYRIRAWQSFQRALDPLGQMIRPLPARACLIRSSVGPRRGSRGSRRARRDARAGRGDADRLEGVTRLEREALRESPQRALDPAAAKGSTSASTGPASSSTGGPGARGRARPLKRKPAYSANSPKNRDLRLHERGGAPGRALRPSRIPVPASRRAAGRRTRRRQVAKVEAVQPVELLEVEDGRAGADAVEGEALDELVRVMTVILSS